MRHGAPKASLTVVVDCLAIAAAAALPAILLWPFDDTPFIDDWVYAWSVERLLATGDLRLLEWSSNPCLVQVLWGALFCLPGGFSFAALRASTWTLSVAGLIGLYLWLREVGVDRRGALLGAATLGANPLWVVLSTTFMTDVPFVAVSIWAALAATHALASGRATWLAAAVALAGLACGVRFIGVALPVALALALLGAGDNPTTRAWHAAIALLPLVAVVLVVLGHHALLVRPIDVSLLPNAPSNRWARLTQVLPSLPRTLPMTACFVAGALGVALLPLTVTSARLGRLRRVAGGAAVVFGLLLWNALAGSPVAPPLAGDGTWTFEELGATAPLIAGYVRPPEPRWAWIGSAAAATSSALWLARSWRWPRGAVVRYAAWLLLGQSALVLALWLLYDRYALALLPPAIVLFLASGARPRLLPASTLVVGYAALALAGVHDHLALSRALWQGVDWLQGHGAEMREIDGGYVVNGWLHYAHPENAPRDARGELFVPDLTVERGGLRYQLALRDLPGWRALAEIPFRRWIAPPGAVRVLERRPTDAGPSSHSGGDERPERGG